MKFNPFTKDIYTDKDIFIKKLSCPYKMTWESLETLNSTVRKCTKCDHFILNTEGITDDDLLKIVRQNPETCLKIDLYQHNIKIISNAILGQK
jgi:hypothetical protein